jgi:hypothetical protein
LRWALPLGGIVETVGRVLEIERRRVVADGERDRRVIAGLGHERRLVLPLRVREIAVQDADVGRVGAAFVELQIVRRDVDAEHAAVLVRPREKFVGLERRLLLLGADVGPDQAAGFAGRIGRRLDVGAETRIAVIGRVLHTAVHAELPAVIEATDAVVLDTAEHQRGAPVQAELVEQADAAAAVAERDEAFAEQTHVQRRAVGMRQLRRGADRHPVAAHHASHRRSGADAREQFIFLGADHVSSVASR